MRRIIIVCLVLAIIGIACIAIPREIDTNDYLRIHIRANSNSDIDQDIKYEIKGEIVRLLSPLLDSVSTSSEARDIVTSNIDNIENVANKVLQKGGMSYIAHAEIRREHFPIRHYGNLTLDEGIYDALIVELGRAEGDNWWCVVFPPLCFVESEEVGTGDFRYVSKIAEIIARMRGE